MNHDTPSNIPELVETLSRLTRSRFLQAWLAQEGKPSIEEAVALLKIWDIMEEAGIAAPDWVPVAHAAMHYAHHL
ncbi:MAG: hypothetical protein WCF04_00155 [Candidatus Nanopelagicales bacterium]